MYVTLCDYGSNNDTGVLQNSGLHDLFGENKVGLPSSKKIPSSLLKPVGDEIFPFKSGLLRPYGGSLSTA